MSVHIEEVPKDLEEQVEELHAQVLFYAIFKTYPIPSGVKQCLVKSQGGQENTVIYLLQLV